MRESYTRLLVINGVEEKEYDELKSRHKNVKGLDGDAPEKKNIQITIDDDGDETSFDNC